MNKRRFLPMSLLAVLIIVSCSGRVGGQNNDREEVRDMEMIPKVKEPQSEIVDTVGFPEESQGTPITGYQGYPEDDLVKESSEDDIVNFEGESDLDYHDGGGGYYDGY